MYAKRLKRKCSVRGCKNTDTFAISRTRELGGSVIICKSCLISEGKGYYKCRKCGCKFKRENVVDYIDEISDTDEDMYYDE